MTPDEIRIAVESALREGITFPWWAYFLPLAAAFAGSWGGAYAKRKGENLATKEDFDQLLAQVKRTTEETEKIKAEVSRISWVDQQRWSLKRELYMELLDSLYAEKEAIFKLLDEEKRPVPTDPETSKLRENFLQENQKQSLAAIKRIAKVRGVAGVLLTDMAQKALDELAIAWYQSFDAHDTDFYSRRLAAADRAYAVVLQSATQDLGVKPTS